MEFVKHIPSFIASNDWVAWILTVTTLIYSARNARKNNEMTGQPKFTFHPFGKKEVIDYDSVAALSPCANKNCNRIHWLDLDNTGSFSAECVRVGIFLNDTDSVDQDSNWIERRHLQSGDKMQISFDERLSSILSSVPTSILLIQYCSPYTNYKYKRAYHLSLSDDTQSGNTSIFLVNEFYRENSKLDIRRLSTRVKVGIKKIIYRLSNRQYDVRLWLQDI